jgi:hypothetical protein
VETLEKFAPALELPLYRLRFDTDKPPAAEGRKAQDGRFFASVSFWGVVDEENGGGAGQ